MSQIATTSRGRKNRSGNSMHNTPMPSRSSTPNTDGSRPPSKVGRIMEKVGGGFRTVFGMGKPMDQGEVDIQEVGVGVLAPSGSNDATIANTGQITSMASSGAQAGGTGLLSSVLTETPEDEVISVLPDPGLIAASTVIREELNAATSSASPKAFQKVVAKTTALGTALKLAAVQIPGLRNIGGLQTQVLSIIEQVSSNKEAVENFRSRCNLLGASILAVLEGKDNARLSDDQKESIERLMRGIQDVLMVSTTKSSKGITEYVLAEDNAELLERVNRRLDELLQCFQIESQIAGTIALADTRKAVQNQLELTNCYETAQALGQLKQVPGAAYDSWEVDTRTVSCLEGTCTHLLAVIGHWMSTGNLSGDTDHNTPLFILDGIAGIGKSTVAMTVAHRAASTNCLGASFFFSRDQEDRKHSYGFMRTIAYQLACYDAAYRNAIAAAVFSNPDALDKVLTLQFDLLVAKPLCSLLKQRTCPLVLVFDALDECVEPDASAVLNLILSSVSQLPNIRVFLTTRPELKLRKKYLGASGAHLFHFQSEDLPLEEDISLYVNHSLSLCKVQEALGDFYSSDWQLTEEEKAKLAKLSGKLFIFASTAIQFILDQQYSDPRHQLGKLLQPGGVSLLSGLYHYILNSAKPAHDIEDWLCRFQEIVGTILILQTPLSSLTLARLLSQKEDAVNATLTNLHSILAPESKKSALIYKVHHRSFYDFVTSHSCPSEFQILEKEQHLHLAKCCLQIMNNQLTWNICQVPTCSKDLEHRDLDVTAYISGELQYATCYWAYHLGKLVKVDPDLLGLFETFSKEHLLHWIEVLAYINQLKTAHNTIKETLDFLPNLSDSILLREIFQKGQDFLLLNSSIIEKEPLSVYQAGASIVDYSHTS